jgi:hypothetical protein
VPSRRKISTNLDKLWIYQAFTDEGAVGLLMHGHAALHQKRTNIR